MSDASEVLVEERDGIVALTMNRPEKRNALSVAMMRALTNELQKNAEKPDVRAFVLRGEGPAFSAGHDLRELDCADAQTARPIFDTCVGLMATIVRVPQPVIAEVGGVATAAGCQLVAACDLAVASKDATFATPGVRIGLFCSTPMIALVRAIGRKRALQMLLTGEPISAQTAADWGLVNAVVEREALSSAARRLAERIAEASRSTVALGKAAFYDTIDLPLSRAYRRAAEVMTANAADENAHEGIDAFLKRRPARFPS